MRARTWRDVVTTVRYTPRRLVARRVLRLVPFKPVDFGTLRILKLDGVPHVSSALLRGRASIRRATLYDLSGLVLLQNKPDVFRERFGRGDWCAVAIVADRIVGYEWFCDQREHYETTWDVTIPIPEGYVYAYDAYIDPKHRNTGIWLHFKAFLADWMVSTGKRGVLTFVEDGNLPSLRTHLRFGFQPSATVLAMKVLGVTLVLWDLWETIFG